MSIKNRQAFTLLEVMVTLALTGIVASIVAALIFFSSRSFVAMSHYTEMNQRGQLALDKMSKDIRQASKLTAFATNAVTFQNTDGTTFGFSHDAKSRKLFRVSGNTKTPYLLNCDTVNFWVFQHTMKSNTFDCYDPAYLTNARVVQITWHCSRDVLGSKGRTENVQSAKVVLRNR